MGYTRTALFYTLLQVLPLGLIPYGGCAAVPADAQPHEVVSSSPADEAAVFARDAAVPAPDVKNWYTVDADGSNIREIEGPPKNGAKSFLEKAATTGSTNLYTFGFGSFNGAVTPPPGLDNFIGDCQFWLIGQVPNYGQGPKEPYPNGQYGCTGSSSANGTIRINKAQNTVGWNMTYNDLSFVIKVVHDVQGILQSGTQYFGFQFQYTPNSATTGYQIVLNGQYAPY